MMLTNDCNGLYNYELKNVAQAQTDLEDLLGKCDDSSIVL